MELNRTLISQKLKILISQIRLLFLLMLSAIAAQLAINDQAFATGSQPPGWSGYGLTQYYGSPL
jgi:hypothetical protein